MPPHVLLHRLKNAARTRRIAQTLFPDERWIKVEPHIWAAESRLVERVKEPEKWEKEVSQVRILTSRGSVAYFLPEVERKGETGKMRADLVLDGTILELKTVAGTRETLGYQFRLGYKQGAALTQGRVDDIQEHSVFIRLFSDLEIDSVRAKIAGELKNRTGKGRFICYFETIGKLYTWTFDELRSIIGR
jgi:hypothetical protein